MDGSPARAEARRGCERSVDSEVAVHGAVAMPIQTDWVQSVLFDRGYLARIRGEAIKVYLVMLEACGGMPDRSVTSA